VHLELQKPSCSSSKTGKSTFYSSSYKRIREQNSGTNSSLGVRREGSKLQNYEVNFPKQWSDQTEHGGSNVQ
jgi:hypothetical protein